MSKIETKETSGFSAGGTNDPASDTQRKAAKKLNVPLSQYRLLRVLVVGGKAKSLTPTEMSAKSGISMRYIYWEINGKPEQGHMSGSLLERGWVSVDEEGIYTPTKVGVDAITDGVSDDDADAWREAAKKRREKFVAAKSKPAKSVAKKPAKKATVST